MGIVEPARREGRFGIGNRCSRSQSEAGIFSGAAGRRPAGRGRRCLRGRRLWRDGARRRAHRRHATGELGTLQIRLYDPVTKSERLGLGACTADSGAPVFETGKRHAVIGFVSWSTGPKLTDGCGGLTGVTPLVRYRTWIVDTAAKLGFAARSLRAKRRQTIIGSSPNKAPAPRGWRDCGPARTDRRTAGRPACRGPVACSPAIRSAG
jgi:hypothetical protein